MCHRVFDSKYRAIAFRGTKCSSEGGYELLSVDGGGEGEKLYTQSTILLGGNRKLCFVCFMYSDKTVPVSMIPAGV